MQLRQFYDIATKVSSRKKCYYFWWSTWLRRSNPIKDYSANRQSRNHVGVCLTGTTSVHLAGGVSAVSHLKISWYLYSFWFKSKNKYVSYESNFEIFFLWFIDVLCLHRQSRSYYAICMHVGLDFVVIKMIKVTLRNKATFHNHWASSTGLTAVSKIKPRLPAQWAVGTHRKGPSRMEKVTSRMNWPIRNTYQIRN